MVAAGSMVVVFWLGHGLCTRYYRIYRPKNNISSFIGFNFCIGFRKIISKIRQVLCKVRFRFEQFYKILS